ncbi:uncharacterized protein LOC111872404 isoform X2 [Cryptotermes secundus]|uniref:uncharacterized protein LOC111872404 isoform X2 n=1 Tax=Cryptotermes secundus TaxID=105785 RepID=UPI000CD7D72B|nr:uncharacterized protein LOC111872404 isoform X2 [Cryptotermes secundus]
MARWTSRMDVLADLNTLSKFSAECDSEEDSPIMPYSSYGRGSSIEDNNLSRLPSPLLNMEADFQLQQSFEQGAGRGERILALSRYQQDESLQRQLRMAMGPGYSNELIEEFMRNEVDSDNESKDGQFDNAEQGTLSCEAVPVHSFQEGTSLCEAAPDHTEDTTEATSYPSSSSAEPVKVENTDAVTSREALKPKKSVRRNRNALLNSLANYSTGLALKSDSRNEIKTNSSAQNHNSALASADAVPDRFKNKSKFPLAAPSAGVSVHATPRVRESERSFQFRDEDFPPL